MRGARAHPLGGAVAAGYRRLSKGGDDSGWLVRIGESGAIDWQLERGQAGTDSKGNPHHERLEDAVVRIDGSIAAAGWSTSHSPGRKRGWIVAATADGKPAWDKVYGADDAQALTSVTRVSDGGVLAGGWAKRKGAARMWLTRLDKAGQPLWNRVTSSSYDGVRLATTALDHAWLSARSNPAGGGQDLLLGRIDPAGNVVWDALLGNGKAARSGAVVDVDGQGVIMVGGDGEPTAMHGVVERRDAWGHGSCAAAGKCRTKGVQACDDKGACTRDRCDPKTGGCQHVPVPAMACLVDDGCSLRGVCTGATCKPGDSGLLHRRTHADIKLRTVAGIAPTTAGGHLVAGVDATGRLALIWTDRYGEVVRTLAKKLAVAPTEVLQLGAALPMSDGGFVVAYGLKVAGIVRVERYIQDGSKQLWTTVACKRTTVTAYEQRFTLPTFNVYLPGCRVLALKAVGGGKATVAVSVEPQAGSAGDYAGGSKVQSWFAKRCAGALQISLVNGALAWKPQQHCGGGHYRNGGTLLETVGWPMPHPTVAGIAADGGAVLAGYGGTLIAPPELSKKPPYMQEVRGGPMVARIGGDGTPLWRVDPVVAGAKDRLDGLAQTADGGVLVAGTSLPAGGAVGALLLKLAANGKVMWRRVQPGTADATPRGLGTSVDGSTLLFGTRAVAGKHPLWIARLGPLGHPLWQATMTVAGEGVSLARNGIAAVRSDGGATLAAVSGAGADGALALVQLGAWGHASCGDAGKCAAQTVKTCADGKLCTVDLCDAAKGCAHADSKCDDNNPCTIDVCKQGLGCRHLANACDDGDACTLDTCDPGTPLAPGGGCAHAKRDCDDGEECTLDSCDSKTGCVYVATAAGTFCTDDDCLIGGCKAKVCSLTAGTLKGCDKGHAAPTCAAIRSAYAKAKTGDYWLDFDGPFNDPPMLRRCDFETGWTRVAVQTFDSGPQGWSTYHYQPVAPARWIDCKGGMLFAVHAPTSGESWWGSSKDYKVPQHTKARLVFDIHFLDVWKNVQTVVVALGHHSKPLTTYKWNDADDSGQRCRDAGATDGVLLQRVVEADHTGTTVRALFASPGNYVKKSYGVAVDNFELWVK